MSSGSGLDGPHVGAMLRLTWQRVWREIFTGVVEAGHDDVNPAHIALFGYPGLDGQRPSELADRLQITRQSVNDLLGHLERHGYLTRVPDPADGRARIVRLTARGRRLQKAIHVEARAAEQRIADALGATRFAQLQGALEELTLLDDAVDPLTHPS